MHKKFLYISGLTALIIIFFDRITKHLVLEAFENTSITAAQFNAIEVTPFFNLVLVWNRGISFGMFNNLEYSNYIFTGATIIIVCVLLYWFRNSKSIVEIIAVGLITGGAVGNLIDRIKYGAVFDFLDFHIYGYHWPAFNIADSAVVIGALSLACYYIVSGKQKEA